MRYAIRIDFSGFEKRWVRVYKNQKKWVMRMHAATATQYGTEADAQAVITKFGLAERKAKIIEV